MCLLKLVCLGQCVFVFVCLFRLVSSFVFVSLLFFLLRLLSLFVWVAFVFLLACVPFFGFYVCVFGVFFILVCCLDID